MDLFHSTPASTQGEAEPLAARMAPREWADFTGQDHLVGEGCFLRRLIDADRLTSSIFFGPPGIGKTALARMAARKSNAAIDYLNAVLAGVADIRRVVQQANERRLSNNKKTLLVIDEIHHFNRTQQDALLPDVERGTLTLVGLTTENPFFYVNAALLSRTTPFEFKPLETHHLMQVLDHALRDPVRGLGKLSIQLQPPAREHFLTMADGDARRLLNSLEIAALTTAPDKDGTRVITLPIAEESIQKRAIRYDKKGDDHYDIISAFIKSLRGSNPDAALYWMAKMIKAGEDPRFIARRILIFASEDVGNADPHALVLATATAKAVEMIGMPEARIILAQAVTYVASAPKSNASYLAIEKALKEVEAGPRREVPNHLKDGSRDGAALGHGNGYQYPHDFPGHFIEQEYMPVPVRFYEPTAQGREVEIKKRLDSWQKKSPTH